MSLHSLDNNLIIDRDPSSYEMSQKTVILQKEIIEPKKIQRFCYNCNRSGNNLKARAILNPSAEFKNNCAEYPSNINTEIKDVNQAIESVPTGVNNSVV